MAQSNPIITEWIQNHSGITGRHYVQGNSTPIIDNVLANVQSIDYSANWVYVTATGIPSYITGPFLDNNPSLAEDQNTIYKLPLNPSQNPGSTTATFGGNIGVFINGVSLFDYRDGVAWNNGTNALCGGPGNPPCPGGPQAIQSWNRDAIPAEMGGFDCAKAHPAMGNYHHHLFPTLASLVGAKDVQPSLPSSALDLGPALRQEDGCPRDAVFYEQEETRAIRTRDWVYAMRFQGAPTYPIQNELYRLEDDPNEKTNLSGLAEFAKVEAKLAAQISTYFEAYSDPKYDLWNGGTAKSNVTFQALWQDAWGNNWQPEHST